MVANHVASSLRGSNPRHNVGHFAGVFPPVICNAGRPDTDTRHMSAEEPQEQEDDEDLRYFVRIGQTDLDGTKSVERSLSEMNGIGRRTARLIAEEAGVDRTATFGRLDDDVIDGVIEVVENYADEVPDWLNNRQDDFYSGETTHEIGNDLQLTRQHDINRMKMIDSYKARATSAARRFAVSEPSPPVVRRAPSESTSKRSAKNRPKRPPKKRARVNNATRH